MSRAKTSRPCASRSAPRRSTCSGRRWRKTRSGWQSWRPWPGSRSTTWPRCCSASRRSPPTSARSRSRRSERGWGLAPRCCSLRSPSVPPISAGSQCARRRASRQRGRSPECPGPCAACCSRSPAPACCSRSLWPAATPPTRGCRWGLAIQTRRPCGFSARSTSATPPNGARRWASTRPSPRSRA